MLACAQMLISCAASTAPVELPGLKLPAYPTHIQPSIVKLPKGPLKAREAMRLMLELRKSELRNARGIRQGREFYESVRREYGKRRRR